MNQEQKVVRQDRKLSRRGFLRRTGGAGAAVLAGSAVSGCSVVGRIGSHTLDFSTDFGVLDYADSLEVMESDFYSCVVANPPPDRRGDELRVRRDIRDHELVHRRFFNRALVPLKIEVPERDFSSVNFNSRESLLTAARIFEDTGTAAFNGAGKLLSLANLPSDDPRAFAGDDIVDEFGIDPALDPPEVFDPCSGSMISFGITAQHVADDSRGAPSSFGA